MFVFVSALEYEAWGQETITMLLTVRPLLLSPAPDLCCLSTSHYFVIQHSRKTDTYIQEKDEKDIIITFCLRSIPVSPNVVCQLVS